MINKNQNKRTFIVSALLLAFLIFILIFAYLSFFINQNENKSDEIKKNDTLVFIRNDVLVKTSDGRGILTNLPKKLDDDFTYSYSFVPKTTVPNKKLFMYVKSSYNTFKLTHDDKIIYERDNIDTDFISSGGDYIKIVMIPDEYIGKKLTISFKSLKQTNYGILVPYIILGTHDDLILYSYTEDLDVLIITAFLLVFGLESFVFHFALIFYKKAHANSFLVSFYALVLGFYIIIRKPIFYFLIPRGIFLYALDYLLFLILPLTIGLFMVSIAKKKSGNKMGQRIIEIMLSLFVLNVIVQTVLVLFGYIEFIELQKLSQIAVVSVALIDVIIPFTIEDFEFKKSLSTATAILMIILIILLGVYLKTYRIRYMTIMGVVGGTFILFQTLVVMKIYARTYSATYKAELNRKLAFTDSLTRILNRNAFENDIKDLEKRGQKMMLMIIDINNLKKINDTLGHNMGDFIIKSAAEILHKVKNNFNKSTPYRIGGDEFVVTAYNVDDNYARKAIYYINTKTSEFRKQNPDIPFNFGMAYEIADIDEDFDINKFMEKVDQKMYEDKREKKRAFNV